MAITFNQTDTNLTPSYSTQCSTAADGDSAVPLKKDATKAGTLGSTEVLVECWKADYRDVVFFGTDAVGQTSWPGGAGNEITFPLDITTPVGAGSVSAVKVSACRMNSSGVSQGVYGSWTGTRVLDTTQVENFTLTTTAQSAAADDWILFIVEVYNSSGSSTEDLGVTPSQTITTAISSATTHTAAAALLGSGVVSASATNLAEASVAMTGTATVNALGGLLVDGVTVDFSGTSSLGAAGSVYKTGAAALDGVTTLAASGSVTRNAATALACSGTLGATPTLTLGASMAMLGDATLVASGSTGAIHAASAALPGVGVVDAIASVDRLAVAALSASAGLTATGTTLGATVSAQAALVSTATLWPSSVAVQLSSELPSGTDYYVSMDLSTGDPGALQPHHFGVIARATDNQNGYLGYYDADLGRYVIAKMVAGDVTVLASTLTSFTNARLRLTVSGTQLTLYVDGEQKVNTSDSTFSAAGQGGVYARKFLATYGVNEALQGDNFAIYSIGAQVHAAAALLAGTGAITLDAVMNYQGSVSLTGTATVNATPQNIVSATCSMSCTATVAAIPRTTYAASVALQGVGLLAVTGTFLQSGQVLFSGTGTITAVGVRQVTGNGLLAAAATLAATPSKTTTASATLDGSATLSATPSIEHHATTALTGSADLVASAVETHAASMAVTGIATLAAEAVGAPTGSASLTATATLQATALVDHDAAAALAGSAGLAALGSIEGTASASLAGVAGFIASGSITRNGQLALSGSATLNASGSGLIDASSGLVGTSTLNAAGSTIISGASASLGSTSALAAAGSVERGASASLVGTATLVATGRADAAATLVGTATLSASAQCIVNAQASFLGTATFTTEARPTCRMVCDSHLTTIPRGQLLIDTIILKPVVDAWFLYEPVVEGDLETLPIVNALMRLEGVIDYTNVNIEPVLPIATYQLLREENP